MISDNPIPPVLTALEQLALDATGKLKAASQMIARLTVEISLLRGQVKMRDQELKQAYARIEKLQTRERAFVRELIQEMTYTASLTEQIENSHEPTPRI